MLNKQYRLTKSKDFEKVARRGNVIYTKEIILKWIKNNLNHPRFGIVTSLKVSKKAVVRNKIKRRIRAILKEYLDNIFKREISYDIMIITKSEIKDLNYQEIQKRLENIFTKAKLVLK